MSDALTVEESNVAVAGGELAVLALGPDSAPPVLSIHGITANALAWAPVAAALHGRGRLIAPDLRGRAHSAALPAPYGTGAYVEDLLALLDARGLGRVPVIGHSLGAYIACRLAVEHPERVSRLLLVDGGLTMPNIETVEDPQAFIAAFLGPALERLHLTFPSRRAYLDWWREHPAFAGHDVEPQHLARYVERDARGQEPEIRSSVREEAVRADASELLTLGSWAPRLSTPALLLCAERGLLDEPSPMQPIGLAREWARGARDRRAELIEGTNHYTITLGARGAAFVAQALAETLSAAAA
jgi:pimeloyl-ACP methyl ester carboxylesterase